MTVYQQLDPKRELPVVPIVFNCTNSAIDDAAAEL